MGLGWDAAKPLFSLGEAPSIDLDASAITFDKAGKVIETIYFRNLKSKDSTIKHSGDNLTGDGDGDDEVIHVNLKKLPEKVQSVVFTVSSFRGQTFDKIKNASCRIVENKTNTEIAKYDLSCSGKHTAMIMAKVYRHDGKWKMQALGEKVDGQTVEHLVKFAEKVL